MICRSVHTFATRLHLPDMHVPLLGPKVVRIVTIAIVILVGNGSDVIAQRPNPTKYQTLVFTAPDKSELGYLRLLSKDTIGIDKSAVLVPASAIKVFPTTDVYKVKVRKRNGMALGALIGFGSGAIAGALIGAQIESQCDPQCGGVVPGTVIGLSSLLGGMVGTGVGVIFGSSKKKMRIKDRLTTKQYEELLPYVILDPGE